ncbi:MAG: class I SAM-dependent methyltransferase [Archangium sp.]|nr:class I SAM-dependent methyltransferase [Archangium sp.]
MRRSTLDLLRCPKCQAGSLVPEADVADTAMSFGPAKCVGCGARYSVHDGMIDFATETKELSIAQQAMEQPWIARTWDRYVRPAVDTLLTRGRLDLESEYTVLRTLVAKPPGPIVDLGCGAGIMLRRLSHDLPGVQLIGVDLSRAMLEEAMAQLREHAEAADFVRAQVPPLPFNDASIGAVIAVGVVHFVGELDVLLREVQRVLKPGGRFVATTYEPNAITKSVHQRAGLHPRDEAALRAAAEKAGLIAFERVKVPPFLLWTVERP